MEDFYKTLGVAKDADEKTIKKAYRALAMKYHPDRNPDNKEAEDKFKEVQRAYETLSDPEKRRNYDLGPQPGFNPFSSGMSGGGFDWGGRGGLDDVINEFFNRNRGNRAYRQASQARPGGDIGARVQLELEEVLAGSVQRVTVRRELRCGTCEGTGAKNEPDSIGTCPQCKGSGQVTRSNGFMQLTTTCGMCGGTGKVIKKPCGTCKGKKFVDKTEVLKVRIPKGAHHGNTLRVPGKGNESAHKNGRNGNLFVEVLVKPHPVFERDRDELYTELKIPYTIAVLGGEIDVPVLGEKPGENPTIKVKLPDGIYKKKVLEIDERGLPNIQTGKRGIQVVNMMVEIPKAADLTDRQKELLMELHSGPDKENWLEDWLENE